MRHFHTLLQSFIDELGVGNGEISQVDRFSFVATRDVVQVAVELLTEERSDGRHESGDGLQAGVQRLVSRQLILVVFALPETATREAHVPVAEVSINELSDGATRTGGLVTTTRLIHGENQRIEFRENPAVNLRTLLDVDIFFLIVELINIGVKGKEGVGVVQSSKELATHFINACLVKLQVVPRLRVGDHIPTHGVGTVFLDDAERVDGVAQTFRHLVAVLVEHQAVGDHILVSHAIETHRGNSVQREEPATGLVDAFSDEVGRERKTRLVSHVMILGVRHSARVEPHVDEVGLAEHFLAAC